MTLLDRALEAIGVLRGGSQPSAAVAVDPIPSPFASQEPRESIPEYDPRRSETVRNWTPTRVNAALDEAWDNGKLEQLADLCEAVQTDGKIRGCLQTRSHALIGTPLAFDSVAPQVSRRGGGIKLTESEAARALFDNGEWWRIVPESTMTQLVNWALLLNFGLAEISWYRDEERQRVWMPRLTVKNPRHVRFDHETRKHYLMVGKLRNGKVVPEEIEITPNDGRWFVFSPFGGGEPWRYGLIAPLAILWLMKTFADFDWARRNEARGRSALVGLSPREAMDRDRKAFAADLAKLRTRIGMVLAHGYDLKSVEFGPPDHDTFDRRVRNADVAVAVLILGQNLTTEVRESGSYAAGKAAERVRQDYLEFDAEVAGTAFGQNLLRHYVKVRFGQQAGDIYPIWDTETADSIAASAATQDRAAAALERLLGLGVDVDIARFAHRFRLPLRTSELQSTAKDSNIQGPERKP
jgi:phage gp29-like protein